MVWAAVASVIFAAVLLGGILLHRSGVSIPGTGPGEMRQSDVMELAGDLQRKPDVSGVGAYDMGRVVHLGREYQVAHIKVRLKSSEDTIYFWVIHCTSHRNLLGPQEGLPTYVSGRFVVYGPEKSMDWLKQYYRLTPVP